MIHKGKWTVDYNLINEAEVEGVEVIPMVFLNLASRAILKEQHFTFAACLGFRWLYWSAYILFAKQK